MEVSNFLIDIGSVINKINLPGGYKENFAPCAVSQGFLTAAVVLEVLIALTIMFMPE